MPLVLTQPDRPAGRGRRLTASPVKELALELGLAARAARSRCAHPAELPPGDRPDLMVVIAYGLLLPRKWLDWPRLGCINLHASLLPRWRGAAPIQRAVLAGDAETGISVMQMDAGLDTGPVHLERATPIGARETAGELHDRLAVLAAQALLEALPALLAGSFGPCAAATKRSRRWRRRSRRLRRCSTGASRPRSSNGECALSTLGPLRRRV